jgi:hypothetical protein
MHLHHSFALSPTRRSVPLIACVLLATGCAGVGTTAPPPSIADTDPTFATPMRPEGKQKYQWWEFQSILDPRSRDIERNLGF